MPERVRFIEHRAREILFFDFAGITDQTTALQVIDEALTFVGGLPKNESLLTLTDVTGSTSTSEVAKALYRLAKHNRPYVRAGAVVGVSGLERAVFLLVTNLARRRLKVFAEAEAAKDWLVARGGAGEGDRIA